MTEKENVENMKKCSRFDSCSVPFCPLDYWQDERVVLSDEPKCDMEKEVRYRIGKNTELPNKGLTKSEMAGKKNWESKTDKEKEAIIKRGKENLKIPSVPSK